MSEHTLVRQVGWWAGGRFIALADHHDHERMREIGWQPAYVFDVSGFGDPDEQATD